MNTPSYSEKLGKALKANCELRDDNCVTPDAVLLFTEATSELEEIEFWELPLKFPLSNPGMRWSHRDLGRLVEAKSALFRQSTTTTPRCGTVVLVDPIRPGPVSWCRTTAPITATESPAH